jgi:Ca2+-binding EF-hand superfamily protein
MVKKDLRINSINGALDKKELQKLNRIVDMIFEKFDHDRSGKLDPSELHGMMK